VLESFSAATDLDLISYLKTIPDARMRRGVRIPAWYLLLVAVLGILSRCQNLRDLGALRHPPPHSRVPDFLKPSSSQPITTPGDTDPAG
jgi:hypothetical protein